MCVDGDEAKLLLLTRLEPCARSEMLEVAGFRVIEFEAPLAGAPPGDMVGDTVGELTLEERILASDPRLHCEGWTDAGNPGRWTRGFASSLQFFGGEESPLRVKVEGEIREAQLILVFLNGGFLGSLRFEGEGPKFRDTPVLATLWRAQAWNEFVFLTPLACEAPIADENLDPAAVPEDRGFRLLSIELLRNH
jgi:hypothetical protein